MLRSVLSFCLLSAFCLPAFAQTDRGTITGTVADPAGAVIAGAAVEARNTGTGALYRVAASNTGNYTIAQLPAGDYELTVTEMGFKTYIRGGLVVQAAQTIRVDALMEVGSATESVTVTAEAPLLRTESGELSNTVATKTMNTLPLLTVGQNSSGIRNPFNLVALLPGAFFQPSPSFVGPSVKINGSPGGSEKVLIDGMDGTNIVGQGANQQNQPGMDAIQEWTVQTSNYAAEFGQAGSAVMNVTMKSGGNDYHGSAYEYFQNDILNAGQPFTVQSGNPTEHVRPTVRRNDYGFTLGGPVIIPKVYDGHQKTFFFFNWEQFRQSQNVLSSALSVPTDAYRMGDFSAALTAAGNRNIGTDPLGRDIIANTIYDPLSRHFAPSGEAVTDPFPGNRISPSRFDPVTLRVQSLIPKPFCIGGPPCNAAGVVQNWQNAEHTNRITQAPSIKVDQTLGPNDKLSFFFSRTYTDNANGYGIDGAPQPISGEFGAAIYAHRERLNYDHTLTPAMLLHLGAGYDQNYLGRPAITPDYDPCQGLGLCSQAFSRPATFPRMTGLADTVAGGASFGGPPGRADDAYTTVDAIANLTWVRGNHTFKFGGSGEFQGSYSININALSGSYGFSPAQTAMPYLVNTSSGSSVANIGPYHVGLPYASFLLGRVDSAQINPASRARFGKRQLGFYVQDSWKVTRRLTLDIGLRYDFSTWYKEQYGRAPNLAPTLANPTAGGHPGSVIYQATCGCNFARNYPFAFGPRLGFAFQVNSKTVLRGGFGIAYTGTGVAQVFGSASGDATAANQFSPSSVPGDPLMILGQGVTLNGQPLTADRIKWPNFSAGYYPIGGVLPNAGPQYYDQNAGRPARQYQWSFSIQREVTPNLVVQASYVANHGVWWPTYVGQPLTNYNYLSSNILNQYGVDLNNPDDLRALVSPVGSAGAGRFRNQLPFSNFPLTATVAQSLRPLPQFTTINLINPPLGRSWYNSMQLTANQRLSHGLQVDFGFTWSQAMDTYAGTPDVQNRGLAKSRANTDQPLVTRIGFTYTVPQFEWAPKALAIVASDWMFNGFLYYASGTPLAAPTANTTGYASGLAQATSANLTFQTASHQYRTGEPLYLTDLNCHCFDPNKDFVLNPAAWQNPQPGDFGGPTYTNDFRGQRRPVENLALGRLFRFGETVNLQIRMELNNVFNRTYPNNPSLTNPQRPGVCRLPDGGTGACSQPGLQIVSGFGSISASRTAYPPRAGQIVARFTF